MKMITAVVNHEDARAVSQALVKQKFYVTRMASSGGFLMSGNDTLMIVTKDERVDDCIHVIAERCRQRTEVVPNTAGYGEGSIAMPMEVTVGGATIFVTNVERMEKL
ncbi:MAG: cyclic-di-AMP receptor [Subdoligranulum sp.]|nr:cyclic-di-AMP receptor [Subdoligranulum sp.]MCI7541737.1 cyclic-di-AMP receptor [Subdoligranulum sp.]MDD7265840.1 cyclic-di-AMP receptor [Subdoligranulum sp.]MDY5924095.1 cyclic-di-AMP receptor [Oscillospiraceae bacterium]